MAVNCGRDWSSELACYAAMTTSRLHVKTSNFRHTGQTRSSSTPVQLVKKMGMPILRISEKLANTKVQTRPSAPHACANRVFS